jgi:dolichol-phosphate mannosyltransferase
VISVVVPTLNEARSVPVLAAAVADALAGEEFEVIVVDDDSPDRTWEVAGGLPAALRVRVIRRLGRTGLGSAVLEGLAAAGGDIVGFMDADLSHPAQALPAMVGRIRSGEADLVVGSRLVPGGGTEGWPRTRKLTSRLGTLLARPLTAVRDPMSGFLLFRRSVIEGVRLKPRGYKIGLEILVKGNARRVVEVPIVFRDRTVGESKLGLTQNLEFLVQLAGLYLHALGKRAWRRRSS